MSFDACVEYDLVAFASLGWQSFFHDIGCVGLLRLGSVY